MLLLEHEIDGLLKRRIDFSVRDKQGGHRVMDYTGLLNEKENQIVELEKKIQNLEERLRRASFREKELEDEVVRLHSALKAMDRSNVTRTDI
jgi:chromosome segregation ATPase